MNPVEKSGLCTIPGDSSRCEQWLSVDRTGARDRSAVTWI